MDIQDNPRTEGDRARVSLIGAAAATLALREPTFPPSFIDELFGRAAPEDLERYRPDQLAAIAGESWDFFARRPPGAPKLRLAPAALTPGVSVLETINDDMPFLFDSVVGELNARGLDISLLVHPVFTIERDEAGNLTGFEGTRKGTGERESFIHIHINALEDA